MTKQKPPETQVSPQKVPAWWAPPDVPTSSDFVVPSRGEKMVIS